MQPTRLQKFQSLDNSAAAAAATAADQTAMQQQQQQKPLVHSISIVVELANEAKQSVHHRGSLHLKSGGSFSSHCSNEDDETTTTTTTSDEHPRQASLEVEGLLEETDEVEDEVDLPRQVAGNEQEEEQEEGGDEEEEEETETASCLASNLARRVVLVDEADKKFMRNRAQSAEPQVLRSIFANFCQERGGPTPPSRCGSASPQSNSNQVPGGGGGDRERTRPPSPPVPPASLLRARHSLASNSLAGAGASQQRPSRLGACELAERGRLSMRRNTHHQQRTSESLVGAQCGGGGGAGSGTGVSVDQDQRQVAGESELPSHREHPRHKRLLSFTPGATSTSQPQQQRSSSPISKHKFLNQQQQSQLGPTTTAAAVAGQQHTNRQHLPVQHRRQSLQIGLLGCGPGARCAADSSRSLTEEELRGEREFNEQVRSAARSPADFFAPRLLGKSPQAGGTLNSGAQQQEPPPRCKSTDHDQQHQITSHNLRPTAQGAGGASLNSQRRRVSFGSIDPIELQSATATAAAAAATTSAHRLNLGDTSGGQFALRKHRHRASICGPILSGGATSTATAGILRKLDRREQHALKPASDIADPQAKRRESKMGDHEQKHELGSDDTAAQGQHHDSNTLTQTIVNHGRVRLASVSGKSSAEPTVRFGPGGDEDDDEDSSRQATVAPTAAVVVDETSQERPMTTTPPAIRKHKSVSVVAAERDANRVHSIMANARLRQEEFARLLEEHEQIVNEINRFETKISASQQLKLQKSGRGNENNPEDDGDVASSAGSNVNRNEL